MQTATKIWTALGTQQAIITTGFASGIAFAFTHQIELKFNTEYERDTQTGAVKSESKGFSLKPTNKETEDHTKCPVMKTPLCNLFIGGISGALTTLGGFCVTYVLPASFTPLVPIALASSVAYSGKLIYNAHTKKH